MKVWLFDPTEMDTADTEDTDDYIFEFSSNWEELEKNTINVNVNKKIKISPNQNLTIMVTQRLCLKKAEIIQNTKEFRQMLKR